MHNRWTRLEASSAAMKHFFDESDGRVRPMLVILDRCDAREVTAKHINGAPLCAALERKDLPQPLFATPRALRATTCLCD